jgi:glutamate dehydrogenase (NADP+)
MEKKAKVVTLSDSDGFVRIRDGLTAEQLDFVQELKEQRRGRLSEFADKYDRVEFYENAKPWGVKCDIAMPCATQNELDEQDAKLLVKNGLVAVSEGANMPTTAGAERVFRKHHILHAPGKAANAGGVAVSGLEQSQNAMRISWSREEVDERLQKIMHDIHQRCVEHGLRGYRVNYVDGANIAGFQKVAEAMLAYGVV